MANFSIATTTRYKNNEKTEWHRITAFGKTAELVAEYIRKGSFLMVEGRIQYSTYQDKTTGQERHSTDIIADRIEFGPKTNSSSTATTPAEDGGYPENWDEPQNL